MKSCRHSVALLMLSLVLAGVLVAQEATQSSVTVPPLVNFSGKAVDAENKPISGIAGITFSIYKNQYEGAPLWLETQNITADAEGNYAAQLGATKPQGLPLDLFSSGEARWLGVRINGGEEQPRVLLLSVPYALKAADAQTLGGLPASAFALAAPLSGALAADATAASSSSTATVQPALAGTGTTDYIPLWTNGTTLGNSVLFQSGSGSTAKVGINTATPASTLDVTGGATVRGALALPATGTATASSGTNSQPATLTTSSFSSSSSAAVNQNFRWQAEPAGNNTSSPSGTLNLLFGSGSNPPTETGFHIASNGQITFAAGQKFPGGAGTVSSVGLSAPSSDFTVSGSPVTSSGTLNFAWNVAPTSSDTANAIVKRDAGGNFSAGEVSALGVVGFDDVVGDNASGVIGITVGASAYGVAGFADLESATGSVATYGQNFSYSGSGVNGVQFEQSATGSKRAFSAGVWGDTEGGIALLGTSDNSNALVAANNSPSGYTTTYFTNASTDSAAYVLYATGSNFGGVCSINVEGNLGCTGTVSAAVALDGGKRKVALSAIQSPKNWFEDAGSGETVKGTAVVALDPDFVQTVNTQTEYQVFLTPYGDCKGLYVTNRTANSFEVHELGGGGASIGFGYRIMALRRNYEGVRFTDHTNDPVPFKTLAGAKVVPGQSPIPARRTIPAGSAQITVPAPMTTPK